MPNLVDTHAHVIFDSYDQDREEVLKKAFDAGIKQLIHPCCNLEEMDSLINLAKIHNGINSPDIFFALGIHPTEIQNWNQESENFLIQTIESNLNGKLRAIGETGLDYYHCKEFAEKQKSIFEIQISLAKNYKLPLIIHSRDASEDTLKILTKHYSGSKDKLNGVMHCFIGDLDFALACIDLGFFISWSGVLTYKKNSNLRDIAAKLSLEWLLVETDSPFLAPQNFRGQRNEPSYVIEIAKILAEIKGISLEDLSTITTNNAQRLFAI